MEKPVIVLVKEHDAEWNYSYSEYQNGKIINKYSYEEVKELRKRNIVIVI